MTHRLRVRRLIALICTLLLAGSAVADEMPASEPVQEPPPASRSFDDRVGDFLGKADSALAYVPSFGVDLLILRPMGTGATVLGFGIFIAASPFALVSWKMLESWETFVDPPMQYTFTRPIGRF